MAKLNFPGSPTIGTIYTDNGNVWKWNGTSWISFNSLDLTSQVSGALGTTSGGTGFTIYNVGDTLYAATADSLGKLPAGATNYVLTSNGPNTAPSWQPVPPSAASSVAVSPTNVNQSFFITAVNSDNGSGLGLSTINSLVVNASTGLLSVSGVAVTSLTNSTSVNSGALTVAGGAGFGKSVSISGRLQLFNNSNYTAFVSSASGNTVYTLPATTPATGSSILSATSGGLLSWVPLVLPSSDTYLVNVNAATGNTVLFIAGVNDDIGSGLAVSSNTNLTYDTNSNKLNSPFYTGTWAGSTITTLYGGTGLSAYTKGDLLVGLGDTLYKLPVGTQGQLLQAFSSATSGIAWTSIMPPTYGAFYSTQSQTVYGVGITTPITLNSTYEAYNTQILGGSGTSSRIQIQTAGTYNVQFSAQINLASGNQPKKGDLWFRINGVDVPQSTTEMAITGKDYQTVLSLNFVSYFAANDYFEIVMSSSDDQYQVEALSGLTSPPRPDIPSMIVTVVPVTQVVGSSAGLGVSGVVSINGLNQYIQYFATGKTGTDFNISSSNFTHTFNIPIAGTGATGLLSSQAQTIGGAKTFASDTIISSTTNSTSSATGALTVTGGVGIGGSLYVASATAISGILINNGIITGDLIGNVTGFASTSRNINLVATSSATPHYLVFSPNASGSGVALSTGSSITVNPNSNVLSIGTGTFAANGVSVGSASNTINTASGNLNIDSFGGQTNLNDNVVISGNLTVQGTTITVDSTVSTFVDPVIVIGSGAGGTHSTLDSNQDRGFEFRWSNSGTAITGFFGFSDIDGKFRFIPQVSSIISNVYTGTAGTAVFTTVEANLSGNSTGTASTYTNFYGTLNGNVIGNVTGNLTGTATTATNVYLAVGANASSHSVIFSPSTNGSGVALSTDSTFTYNPNTDTLTVSNITGTATTASYAHQAGYAITSGSASIATTATYSYQAGYAITSGSASIATTSTYAHQAGYAITSGSSNSSGSAITSNNIAIQNGLNNSTHSVIFAPAVSGSGIALSSNQTITFNPFTSIFSVSGIAVTANTNSTLTSNGAAIITGGVGIGQSLSVAGRLQLFNGSNYTAFVYSGNGNTVYTLPTTSPATGTSVLQSTSGGVLSWVPMVASSSSGTTAQNIVVNAAGTADVFHQLLFTPAQQSAGSAVSSDVLLSFNANSDRLFVSGISVTSGTASTTPFTGALQVAGGLGVSGQATFARASLGFTGVSVTPVMSFIGATTAPIISLSVLNDNSLSFEGSSGQLFSIDNNLSTGEIFSVSDISGLPIIAASAGQTVTINEFGGVTKVGDGTVNASSSSNAALVVSGGLGVTGNAFIGGTASITNSATSTSTTTGALVVTGGVGIGGSLYTATSVPSSISGVVLSNSIVRTGTWAATAITSFYGGTGHSIYTSGDLLVGAGSTLAKLPASSNSGWVLTSTGANSIPSWQAVPASAASSVAVSTSTVDQSFFITFVNVSSGSGLGLTTTTSFVVNPSSGLVTASGLALTSLTNSSSTSTGTLKVSGGLGVTGNAFIGGTINASSANQSNISNVYFTNGNVTGISVTATTIQGLLVGTATTATNVHLASTGNVSGPFYLAMSASSTGSGLALSSDTSLQYNSASDVLTVPYISGTAITASTSFSGQLFGDVTGTATTATYAHQSGYAITAGIATTARNLSVANASANSAHPIYFGPSATGTGVAVSSNPTISFNPSSLILSTSGLAVTSAVVSTSSSTGALIVTGGVGIGGSLYVASAAGISGVSINNGVVIGNLTGTATTSTYAYESGYGITAGIATTARNIYVANATANTPHTIYFGPSATGSGIAVSSNPTISFNPSSFILSTSGLAVTATTASTNSTSGALVVTGGVGIGDSLFVAGNISVNSGTNGLLFRKLVSGNYGAIYSTNVTPSATNYTMITDGASVNFNGTNGVYFNINNTNKIQVTANNINIVPTAESTSSSTGAFTVGGGVGIGGSLYVASATAISGVSINAGIITGNLTGTATTSRSIFVNAASTSADHYMLFSPSASGAGVALSTGANLVYNPLSNVLSIGNGSFAANGVSIGLAFNTISTASGSLNLDSVSGQTNINDNLVISGNLTVQGTTITVDSTISTFVDPVIVLGSGVGGTHSTLDNNQDRGIEFRWSNSGTATTGFFGFNDSDGKFRFIPNATISSSNVYTGTVGTAVFAIVEATLSGNSSGTASTYTNFYGNLTGTASTSTNIHLASTGNVAGPFYLAMSSSSSGAGLALSTDTALSYNSATDVLTVSYVSGTAITASTSFSGQLFGNVTGIATSALYSHQAGYGITAGIATTATNVHLAAGANAANHSVIFAPSATGSGVALSTDSALLYNPNTDTLSSTNFAGNLTGNVTGTATTSTNIHLASTGNVVGPFYLAMSSSSSGAGLALSTDTSLAYNSATDVLTVSYISGTAITASTSFSGQLFGDVTGTATTSNYSYQSGYGITAGIATTARNISVSNASANSAHPMFFGPTATGSGVAVSSNTTLSFNPSSFILSTSGLAVTSTAVSTNSSSGALVVSGGVGIGGTLNIDGNVKINFTNHTAFNVSDIFTVYPVNNFEGANIKSNYSYAFNVQDKSNNNRFTIDVGNNKTILSGNSFSHELRIYNANQVGYTGFVAASSGTVTYTLPAGDGSANFLLKTDGGGALSWVNISGLAVTNINGINSSYQYLAYDYSGTLPAWTSSGSTHTLSIPIASTGATGLISTQAQSFAGAKTFINDVFVSSSTASTWSANGALRVAGGLGVSGQLSFNQAAIGYTGAINPSIAFIGGTTGTPITMTVLSDNSLIFEGTSGKLFGINNNLSSGWIFNVGDISGLPLIRANADGTIAMTEFAGNVGIGMSNPAYKLHVSGSVGFTSSVGSSTVTTGALIVSGGVGIGNSVSVGGRLQLFNGSNFTAFVSSATGNTVYTLPATSPATGSSVLSSTSGGVLSWVPMTSGSSSGTVNAGTANYAAYYATSSTAVSENANLQFTGTGLSVGGNINSSSTRSGSLYVSGGLGITGNAFIGGTVNITNTTAATGVSNAALVVSGGLGVDGDVYVANSVGSKLSIMQSSGDEGGEIFLNKPVTNTTISNGVTVDIYQNRLRFFEQGGSNRGFYLDISTGGNGVGTNIMGGSSSGTVNSGTATFAAFYAGTSNAVSENANLQFTGTGLSVGGNINSTSTRSGSLYVSGGLGVTGNAFIGGTTIIQNTTAATSTNSGALVVAGGVGIGGSLYVGDAIRVGTDTYSKVFERGDILLDNGTNDSPGTKYYWQNNKNFGTDVYSPGTGITKYRIVKELGESGGQELVTVDREATLYLHNHTNTSLYAGFRFSGSGSTVYTLPPASPAIGTSYLVSNSSGVMSWIRPKRSYVLSFGAGFTPTANSADTVQLNIPYAPDNVALNYIVKRVEYRNETVSGGTGLSFYIERHTGGDALWSTAHRIHAGSGASFEVGALVNQISFTTINSSAGTNGLVASGDYIRLYFTTVGSAANVSISLTIEEQ